MKRLASAFIALIIMVGILFVPAQAKVLTPDIYPLLQYCRIWRDFIPSSLLTSLI